MRKVVKWVLALVMLLIFIGTLAVLSQFFEIPVLSSQVDDWIRMFPWMLEFLKGILVSLIIISFFLLLLVLAVSGKRTSIDIKEKDRHIKIPRKTIESIVENVTDETIHADQRKLKIKIKRKNRVVVRMKLLVRSKSSYQLTADELRREIETALTDALQTTNHLVIINLIEVDSENKAFGGKKSRVV